MKNRGRTHTTTKVMPTANNNIRATQQQAVRPQIPGGVVLPNNFQVSNPGQYIQVITVHILYETGEKWLNDKCTIS